MGESMLTLPRWQRNSSPWVCASSDSQMRMRLSVCTALRACALAASHPLLVKLSTLRSVSWRGTSLALLSTRSRNWPTAVPGHPAFKGICRSQWHPPPLSPSNGGVWGNVTKQG